MESLFQFILYLQLSFPVIFVMQPTLEVSLLQIHLLSRPTHFQLVRLKSRQRVQSQTEPKKRMSSFCPLRRNLSPQLLVAPKLTAFMLPILGDIKICFVPIHISLDI